MGRPFRKGLRFFSHDTDMSNDPKIQAIEALYEMKGYAVFNKLLEKIYNTEEGYIEVKTELQIKVLADIFKFKVVEFTKYISDAVEIGLFDKEAYTKQKILTSNGVRKRIAEVQKDRQRSRKWNEEHRDNTTDDDNKDGKDGDSSWANRGRKPSGDK